MEIIKKNTILVIDDDIDFVNLLHHRVTKYNVELVTHESADLLKDMFDKKQIFLILLDLNFYDEMRGLKFIEIIRKKYTSNVPIVIVSAVKSTSIIAKALEMGACEYLNKPLLRYQFNDLIEKYLEPIEDVEYFNHFTKIKKESQKAEVKLQLSVSEVLNNGFSLNSSFMITKGTKLVLSSSIVEEIFNLKSIKLFVTKNSIIDETRGQFLIETEIDEFDESKIEMLRSWLLKMKSRNLK